MRVDGTRMQRLRLEAGLSLRGLSRATGLAHDTVQEIEAGKRSPHPGTVKKLADAIGCTVAELVDWQATDEEIEEKKDAA